MKNILGLDVDGVMNTGPFGGYGLRADKLDLLKDICVQTQCQVLITSSWRKFPHQLTRLMKELELRNIPVLGMTPVLDQKTEGMLFTAQSRTVEIVTWLRQNREQVGRLCLLDDEPLSRPLTYHQIKTETDEGLTPIRAQAACEMLLFGREFDKSTPGGEEADHNNDNDL